MSKKGAPTSKRKAAKKQAGATKGGAGSGATAPTTTAVAANCRTRIRTLSFPDRAERAAELRAGVAAISAALPQAE